MELTDRTDTLRCRRCGGMIHPDEGREVIVGVLRATHLDPPEYEHGFMCHECEEALWYDPEEVLLRVEAFKRLDKWYS